MYEVKENKEACSFIMRHVSIMWKSHKIKWDNSTTKLKDMCGNSHMENECDSNPEERKYRSDSL